MRTIHDVVRARLREELWEVINLWFQHGFSIKDFVIEAQACWNQASRDRHTRDMEQFKAILEKMP
jgi:hypothetical protein